MDIKNRQTGIVEHPLIHEGGEIVLFDQSTFEVDLGKTKLFGTHEPIEKFLAKPVSEAPVVALQIIDKKDSLLFPDIMTEIEEIRTVAVAEDAVKLDAARGELELIRNGIKP